MAFIKATRTQVKLKIGLQGPSGSGKTDGALALARAIVGAEGKIALVDTENESASLYSDRYDFDTMALRPPYLSKRYIEAINDAHEAGYDVLILDSISHQWSGEGGILARKEELDKRPGSNSYTNWATFTPEQERFKAAILNAPLHIIATLRAKQDYVLETNERGKQAPRKVGLAPVQREGMEYEFSVVFELQMDHRARVSKDRTGLFDTETFYDLRDRALGKQITDWLSSAKPAPVVKPGVQLTADDLKLLRLPGTKAHFAGFGGAMIVDVPRDLLPGVRDKLKLAGPERYAAEIAAVEHRLAEEMQPA